ncbi:MAG: SAM-dependent methyltransferase [Pseudomonadota bacterium]
MTGVPPTRQIIQAEALAWMAANAAPAGTSVITSLPDLSEVPERGFEGWKVWFGSAARAVLRWVPNPGLAIFFQSDIRHAGAWLDKGYLVQCAAEAEGRTLLWHKVVCRVAPGTVTHGRASYSHLLCFAHAPRSSITHPGPDVLPDAGHKPWSKAMGVNACRLACRFLREETETLVVVDPFCGHGTALAVANHYGFDALGVELSTRKVRAARRLLLDLEKP